MNGLKLMVQVNGPKTEEFYWDIKVPPKKKINANLLVFQPPKIIPFEQGHFKFQTGFLKGVQHDGFLKIEQQRTSFNLELPSSYDKNWTMKACNIEFYSTGELLSSHKIEVSEEIISCGTYELQQSKGTFEDPSEVYWKDNVNRIKLRFSIEFSEYGQIGVLPEIHDMVGTRQSTPEGNAFPFPQFLLSKELSDFTFICEGKEFPSHKLILSGQSQVFNRMLNSDSQMLESKLGKIEITDIKSNILTELLRFIYCGKVENLDEISVELILAADKYDLPKLKTMCANSLVQLIDLDNAFMLYSLADSINVTSLLLTSLNFIKSNGENAGIRKSIPRCNA